MANNLAPAFGGPLLALGCCNVCHFGSMSDLGLPEHGGAGVLTVRVFILGKTRGALTLETVMYWVGL